jgi:CRISPR-associated Cas5-like protein
MVWVCTKYIFGSTFSYRIPYFSSSYALSAPAPSPSTVKQALIASAINRSGNVEKGKELFEKIKSSSIVFGLPEKIIVFKAFMKRLKQKRKGQETKIKTPFGDLIERFEHTFGIREYVIYGGPLTIYMDVPEDSVEETLRTAKGVQYFGTSDSLCTCVESYVSKPNFKGCAKQIEHCKELLSEKGFVFLLLDFTKKTTFDSINPFSGKKLKKSELVLKSYLFPMEIVKRDKNCTIYHAY